MTSLHEHVFKLPSIVGIDVFRKQLATSLNGSPLGILTDHRAEIRALNFQTTSEVHLVGFDNAHVRVLQHPDNPSKNGGSDLQPSGILIWHETASLLDRKLRSIPVGIPSVAVQQDTQFIDSVDNVVL